MYRIHCEEIGVVVNFLSIRVSINSRGFSTEPIIKRSGPPLGQSSCHPPGVSRWPVHHLRSLGSLCSSLRLFLRVRCEFVSYFREYGVSSELLEALAAVRFGHSEYPRPQRPADRWLVLPFHPACKESGLSQALGVFSGDGCWSNAFRESGIHAGRVRLAWRNSRPSLAPIVRKHNRGVCA